MPSLAAPRAAQDIQRRVDRRVDSTTLQRLMHILGAHVESVATKLPHLSTIRPSLAKSLFLIGREITVQFVPAQRFLRRKRPLAVVCSGVQQSYQQILWKIHSARAGGRPVVC
jgi:hypothetical protein